MSLKTSTKSSSIEKLPAVAVIDGIECYLRIKKKVSETGKAGWFIRYITPTSDTSKKISYDVKFQQGCATLEHGAKLTLKKLFN